MNKVDRWESWLMGKSIDEKVDWSESWLMRPKICVVKQMCIVDIHFM